MRVEHMRGIQAHLGFVCPLACSSRPPPWASRQIPAPITPQMRKEGKGVIEGLFEVVWAPSGNYLSSK